jgi:hypothetical protein
MDALIFMQGVHDGSGRRWSRRELKSSIVETVCIRLVAVLSRSDVTSTQAGREARNPKLLACNNKTWMRVFG